MNLISKGTRIKCVLRDNVIVDGVVEDITDDYMLIKSLDNKVLSIINRPSEFIMVMNVLVNDDNDINIKVNEVPATKLSVEADPNRIKTLVELRNERVALEKEEIANKLKSFEVGEVRKVPYEYPGFYKKSSTK